MSASAFRKSLVAWYRKTERPLPWRTRFAASGDPYVVWVSEIMLQQTVIKAVLPVYDRFLARFPTVEALAAGDEESVRQAVRGLGYYRRFRMLHQAARELTATEGWRWPTTFDGWRALPGVGEYTAAAVTSIAFGAPHAVLDGNVERVLARRLDLRASPAEPPVKRRLRAAASELLGDADPSAFNQGMMELGQTICTVSSPRCDECPVADGCLARANGSQALAPAPKTRIVPKDVAMRLVIVTDGTKVGLVERPRSARFLKGALGFLTLLNDGDGTRADGGDAPAWLDVSATPKTLGRVKHSITHHKITASVDDVQLDAGRSDATLTWLDATAVEERLISNLDRKAWKLFRALRSPRRP